MCPGVRLEAGFRRLAHPSVVEFAPSALFLAPGPSEVAVCVFRPLVSSIQDMPQLCMLVVNFSPL